MLPFQDLQSVTRETGILGMDVIDARDHESSVCDRHSTL